jgi:hypothetical protein
MAGDKRKKAQEKILNEIHKQLVIKAKKLGIEDQITPLNFEKDKLDAAHKILDDLNMEKTNIEYELYMKGILDKESTIKLEKINTYINRAKQTIEKYQKNIDKMSSKDTAAKEKGQEAANKMVGTPKISVNR